MEGKMLSAVSVVVDAACEAVSSCYDTNSFLC